MAVMNQAKIKNNPPKGVRNQIFFAEIMSKEITKMDPENKSIPAKKIKDISFLDLSVNKAELLIKSKANTWYII